MRRKPLAAARRRAPLVLLVDDDRDNRVMYRKFLEWEGFRVGEATDGVEAVRQTMARKPAVIVTDVALPRLSGWDVVRRLKADARTRDIRVLALTAHAFVSDAARARAAGCDGYLTKPCLPEDLARAIRSVLKPGRSSPSGRPARSA